MQIGLWPHPARPSAAVDAIEVSVERLSATLLRFRYLVLGRIDSIAVPQPAPPLRADNLWKTTCFEAFLAPANGPGYRELNFSPSSRWAAYDFSAYRADMVQAAVSAPPHIALVTSADRLELVVTLSLDLPDDPYRLGLFAIIEERGRKSFWAANHAGDAPDFHHPACFALELPAAARP